MRRVAKAACKSRFPVPSRTMLTSLFVETESRAGSPMPMFGNPHIGSTAGIVYLHDVWGLDDQGQVEPNSLAAGLECHVACPDFYRGYTTRFPPDAWHQAISCSPSDVVADCMAARRFLMEDCGCETVGVYGQGIGSALALISACSIPWDCAVCISGLPPLDKFAFEDVISSIPFLLCTGTEDSEMGFSSATDYTYAAAEMARVGKNVRYLRASGLGHRWTDGRFNGAEHDNIPTKKLELLMFLRRHLLQDRTHPETSRVKTAYDQFDKRDAEVISVLPEDATYGKRLKQYMSRRKAELSDSQHEAPK